MNYFLDVPATPLNHPSYDGGAFEQYKGCRDDHPATGTQCAAWGGGHLLTYFAPLTTSLGAGCYWLSANLAEPCWHHQGSGSSLSTCMFRWYLRLQVTNGTGPNAGKRKITWNLVAQLDRLFGVSPPPDAGDCQGPTGINFDTVVDTKLMLYDYTSPDWVPNADVICEGEFTLQQLSSDTPNSPCDGTSFPATVTIASV